MWIIDNSESSFDYSTKKYYLSMKAANIALASMDKTILKFIQAISGRHDQDIICYKKTINLNR